MSLMYQLTVLTQGHGGALLAVSKGCYANVNVSKLSRSKVSLSFVTVRLKILKDQLHRDSSSVF